MDICELKAAQRQWAKAARAALSPAQRAALSARVCEQIEALSEYAGAQTIMLYRAVACETDLSALAAAAQKADKTVLWPRCEGRQLQALCPRGGDAWQRGAYDIPEPIPARSELFAPETIDLVVAPCVAFDERCRRLGMGGGYYDRYIPRCARAFTLLAAFSCQQLVQVAADDRDAVFDAAVSEGGVIRRAGR